MTFATEFGDLLTDTMMLEVRNGVDAYSRPTFALGVPILGRLERRNRRVLATDNTETVAAETFYCGPLPAIIPGDRLTDAQGYNPVILSVERLADEKAQYYQAVIMGHRSKQ